MNTITKEEIRNYIQEKNFSSNGSKQTYESVLKQFSKIISMCPNESTDSYIGRFSIGRSKSSVKFAKSVFNGFIEWRSNINAEIEHNDDINNEETNNDDTVNLTDELKRTQELERIQAENLKKTQNEARKQAEILAKEQERQEKIKAEKIAREQEEKRQARLRARTAGFESQDFPDYIEDFSYMENIPKKSKEYFSQGNEETKFKIAANSGNHPILSGSAGSGKTELVIKYAHETETPIFKFSCSSGVTMGDLIGTKTITESDGKQKLATSAGMLTKAILTANKHGKAILLLDEINTLTEKVQKNINGIADGTEFIDIPQGRIAINEGVQFLICGTMNLSYSGTVPLNPELKDRFVNITMPKMSDDTKKKIYARYNPAPQIEEGLIRLTRLIEEKQQKNEIDGTVVFSTRSQLKFFDLLENFEAENIPNGEKMALDMTLVSKFEDIEERNIVENLVDRIF